MRPRKPRLCACPHREKYSVVFKPAGIPQRELNSVQIERDELESFYLCDGQGLTQESAGCCMGVSRGTVQRLLASARQKIAMCLVQGSALAIGTSEPGSGGVMQPVQ